MPLFEFECESHGRFEILRTRIPDGERHECPSCPYLAPLVASRVTMRPDPYWAGHVTEHGYVTSSSKLRRIYKDRHLVEIGDRADREAMKKTADEAAKAKEENFAKQTRAFFEEQFSGHGLLDSEGNLKPEATRKLSDKTLLDPRGEEQAQKKEIISITTDNE